MIVANSLPEKVDELTRRVVTLEAALVRLELSLREKRLIAQDESFIDTEPNR